MSVDLMTDILYTLGFDDDEIEVITTLAHEFGETTEEFLRGAIKRRAGL